MSFERRKRPPGFVADAMVNDPQRFRDMSSAGGKKAAENRRLQKEAETAERAELEAQREMMDEAIHEEGMQTAAEARHDDLLPEDD